ncbi:hypothetical protein B0H14DRAFT_2578495 [Mycena olivaceomarginata]|nr:hypothetical protein B0H14DRAFT_2578495 [Mycena olivaceomarginata]
MDDIQLVVSGTASDLLAFRDCPFERVNLSENHTEMIEILSSDDEKEVEASLRPSGASSDPPDPSDSSDHNDSNDESGDFASVALLTTFSGTANIISRTIDGPATINRQGKVEHVEYLNQIPSFFPVPRKKKTAYILDLRDEQFDYFDADGVPLRADCLILNKESFETSGSGDQTTTCTLFNGEPVECVVSAEVATRMSSGDIPEKLAAT